MSVDFDTFLEWAKDRFGEENIRLKYTGHGVEIMTHSFYAHRAGIEDHKFHLWMNPSGGKSDHGDRGSFRCWKTDTKGSLVKLVAEYDGVPYEVAEEQVCGTPSLRLLEQKVNEFFGHKEQETPAVAAAPAAEFALPEFSYLIDEMNPSNFMGIEARRYLAGRKLPTDGLYVCTHGDYKNRIIIPYYGPSGELIYFNARLMNDKKNVLRYLKAPADVVSQDNVLFMTSWPRPGSKIYIMEGEFDALSLKLAGLVGCAVGGKFMSDTQIEMIRQYVPVLAFDSDSSGIEAMIAVGNTLLEKGFPRVHYVGPPKVYKDWNKLLKERNVYTLKAYIEKYERVYTVDTPSKILANRL